MDCGADAVSDGVSECAPGVALVALGGTVGVGFGIPSGDLLGDPVLPGDDRVEYLGLAAVAGDGAES